MTVTSLSPRFMISLIMVNDLTFRNRFVNVRRHIILLVSQTLNNEWHILLCDSLGMPFELHVATDKHNTEWWRYHHFKQAIATLSATNLCLRFSWVICMFPRIPEGREEMNLMIIFRSMCTWIENAQYKSPPDVNCSLMECLRCLLLAILSSDGEPKFKRWMVSTKAYEIILLRCSKNTDWRSDCLRKMRNVVPG